VAIVSARWSNLWFGGSDPYPVGLIVVIPCLYLLFHGSDNLPNWKLRLLAVRKSFLRGSLVDWLGIWNWLFLGHPMLFLDPRGVLNAITRSTRIRVVKPVQR